MDSAQDTEITLGTAKLLGLFFGLVIICAVFFALGYTLGRKSDAGLISSAAPPLVNNASKPASSALQAAPPMTFYKSVEQKNANAQLTPATASNSSATADQPNAPQTGTQAGSPEESSQNAGPPDALAPVSAGAYFVQVAAVSKQEDAESLVDALKQKQYPAFVASGTSADKLFRVQLGPFGDIKDAEAMRSKLVNDGYNPILKK